MKRGLKIISTFVVIWVAVVSFMVWNLDVFDGTMI